MKSLLIPSEQRQIRVFISSTFQDMQAEREHLIKHTFPKLRKLCDSRGVTLCEVDLRWGIPSQEIEEGRLLSTCLNQIDYCRPYFIGILGNRYGSALKHVPEDVAAQYPWLNGKLDCSITELEIIHALAHKDRQSNHSYFYLRDCDDKGTHQVESATNEGERQIGDIDEVTKLQQLRQIIRIAHKEKTCELRENFRTPEELGEWVFEDFSKLIDHLFPSSENLDAIAQERFIHEGFARNFTRFYISRPDYFEQLDSHIAGDGKPLVIIGESGVGKSALLANWFIKRFRSDGHTPSATQFSLIHFIGSTPDSTNANRLCRRILTELKDRFPNQLLDPLTSDEHALSGQLKAWIEIVSKISRIVLVLDGFNQLELPDAGKIPSWLLRGFPPNCRLIISTLKGSFIDAIKLQMWSQLELELFQQQEKVQLINNTFSQYGKKLEQVPMERICSAPQTANPLFLRSVLEELRQFGEHDQVSSQLNCYLTAKTPGELFRLILQRWCNDYGRQVVRDSLASIWASQKGLLENEVLGILEMSSLVPAHAQWASFYIAAEANFTSKSGLLCFSHSYLRAAVQEEFLADDAKIRAAHKKLAQYFAHRVLDKRELYELAWQYSRAHMWEAAARTLSDEMYLSLFFFNHEEYLSEIWDYIESNSSVTAAETYINVLQSPNLHDTWVKMAVSHVLNRIEKAQPINEIFDDLIKNQQSLYIWKFAIGSKINNLAQIGNFEAALELSIQALERHRNTEDWDSYANILVKQAVIFSLRKEFARAVSAVAEAEKIYTQELAKTDHSTNYKREQLANSKSLKANILKKTGHFNDALNTLEEAHDLFEKCGDETRAKETVAEQARCLMELGLLASKKGSSNYAMSKLRLAEMVLGDLGYLKDALTCKCNRAVIALNARNDLLGFTLLNEAEDAFRDLMDLKGIAGCLRIRLAFLQQLADDQVTRGIKEDLRIVEGLLRGDTVNTATTQKMLAFRYRKV